MNRIHNSNNQSLSGNRFWLPFLFDILNAIAREEPAEDQATLMELFHSKVVLEYHNAERWIAINPIVQPLLKRRF